MQVASGGKLAAPRVADEATVFAENGVALRLLAAEATLDGWRGDRSAPSLH